MNESILIIMPDFFDYPQIIRETLKAKSIEADVVIEKVPNNFVKKIEKKAFKKIYEKTIRKAHRSMIQSIENKKYTKVVYVFGGFYGRRQFISDLRKKFNEAVFIYYNRDTVSNFPRVLEFVDLFDYKFSFDKKDCYKYNFTFLPLFYSSKYCFNTEKNNQCLCLMTFSHRKANDVDSLLKSLPNYIKVKKIFYMNSKVSYVYNYLIHFKEFRKFKYKDFVFKKISYQESMKLISEFKYIIDAPLKGQNGLTIRTLESFSNKTKIITSNRNILEYDLYNPNNVFLINSKNDDGFFAKPFSNSECIKKYELDTFLDNLLMIKSEEDA